MSISCVISTLHKLHPNIQWFMAIGIQPNIMRGKCMKISKISNLTNTPASTIRDYELLEYIEPAKRLGNRYR